MIGQLQPDEHQAEEWRSEQKPGPLRLRFFDTDLSADRQVSRLSFELLICGPQVCSCECATPSAATRFGREAEHSKYEPGRKRVEYIVLSVPVLIAVIVTQACLETNMPPEFEPGPLGAVTLEADEAIRIRMLLSVTVAPTLGEVARHGAGFAAEDMGPVRGRRVELGDPVDTSCSPQGGRAGALGIAGDPQVAGIIGTGCSAAAVAASPVVSDAGLVMISPSNTSPRLTSDLAGNAGPDHHPGYFRVSSNDLHQARALSDFVYNELDLRSVATLHDGDPYTSSLVGGLRRRVLGTRGRGPGPGRHRKGPRPT